MTISWVKQSLQKTSDCILGVGGNLKFHNWFWKLCFKTCGTNCGTGGGPRCIKVGTKNGAKNGAKSKLIRWSKRNDPQRIGHKKREPDIKCIWAFFKFLLVLTLERTNWKVIHLLFLLTNKMWGVLQRGNFLKSEMFGALCCSD